MGIKNFHIILIAGAAFIGIIFGFWGLNNNYANLGVGSFIISGCLIAYGINFIKKTNALLQK